MELNDDLSLCLVRVSMISANTSLNQKEVQNIFCAIRNYHRVENLILSGWNGFDYEHLWLGYFHFFGGV